MKLWLIDDSDHWHTVTAFTVAQHHNASGFHVDYDSYYSGLAAIMDLEHNPTTHPDLILMDYYIGFERGDTITGIIRKEFPQAAIHIIGYSSVASASQSIVRAGGNEVLIKTANKHGYNPYLLEYLQTYTQNHM